MNRGNAGIVTSPRLGSLLMAMVGAIALIALGSACALESGESGQSGALAAGENSAEHTALSQDLGSDVLQPVSDGVWECVVYFAGGGCTPGDDDCYYYGRDPDRTAAEDEALEECKFNNRMQGRNCRRQGCDYIERP